MAGESQVARDLGWELGEIAARGVSVVLVFACGDPGIELPGIQGGSAVKWFGDRRRVHIIDSLDHTFTQSGTRAALTNDCNNSQCPESVQGQKYARAQKIAMRHLIYLPIKLQRTTPPMISMYPVAPRAHPSGAV
jgi:hypothetical protein